MPSSMIATNCAMSLSLVVATRTLSQVMDWIELCAMLLEEPESNACLGPIGCEAGWFGFVEDADSFGDLS